MKKHLLSALLFLAYFSVFGQTNFQKGYVVTTSGDTLKGFIDYREWNRNPEKISFKAEKEAQTEQEFNPVTLRAFEVTGLERYEAFAGRISNDETQVSRLSSQLDTTSTSGHFFLREQYRGKALSLLSYTDKMKARYFIKEQGQKPQELFFRRYYGPEGDKQVLSSTPFKNQLQLLAAKYAPASKIVPRRIAIAQYQKADLLYIVEQMSAPAENQQDKNLPLGEKVARSRFFVGAEFNQTTMDYKGDKPIYYDQNTSFYTPKAIAGVDVLIFPSTKRLILRAEVSLMAASQTFKRDNFVPNAPVYPTTYKYSLDFSHVTASVTPQVLFNFYNGQRLKMFGSVGGSVHFSSYGDNHFKQEHVFEAPSLEPQKRSIVFEEIENYEDFKKVWFSLPLKVGASFYDRFEAYFVLANAMPIADNEYKQYSLSANSVGLGVNYLFKR